MREKYVDERVGVWFIYGVHKDGTVDVHSAEWGDHFEAIPREKAEQVIEAHDKFREQLYSILCQPTA